MLMKITPKQTSCQPFFSSANFWKASNLLTTLVTYIWDKVSRSFFYLFRLLEYFLPEKLVLKIETGFLYLQNSYTSWKAKKRREVRKEEISSLKKNHAKSIQQAMQRERIALTNKKALIKEAAKLKQGILQEEELGNKLARKKQESLKQLHKVQLKNRELEKKRKELRDILRKALQKQTLPKKRCPAKQRRAG